jgi:hypothetical protein
VICQPGADPISVIEGAATSSVASCSCGDCRIAPAVVPEMMAVTARAAKMDFFMGLSSVSPAVLADGRKLPGWTRCDLKCFTPRDLCGHGSVGGDYPTLIDKSGAATVSESVWSAAICFIVRGPSWGNCAMFQPRRHR